LLQAIFFLSNSLFHFPILKSSKLIKKYSYEKFAEKYILFKEFLEWLEDNHTGHSIYFREEVLCDETLVSQFEITFSDVLDYKSIVHYISDENKERLNRK